MLTYLYFRGFLGLPLAVTLSLAYSMRQMMADNCLVRRYVTHCATLHTTHYALYTPLHYTTLPLHNTAQLSALDCFFLLTWWTAA